MRGCWKEAVGLVAVVLKHSFCHLNSARFHSQHHCKLSQKIWQNYGDNKEIESPQSYSRPHCLDACYHVLQASHKWSHKPKFSHASVQKPTSIWRRRSSPLTASKDDSFWNSPRFRPSLVSGSRCSWWQRVVSLLLLFAIFAPLPKAGPQTQAQGVTLF